MLGAGGVGGLVGAALARSGSDVTLLMRPESLAAYSGRVRVESAVLGDFEVEVPAAPALTARVDVLWVTPKAPQLAAALAQAPPEVVADGRVVTLMNGTDHLRVLQERYAHVVAGAMRVESERVAPGWIRQTSPFIRVQLAEGEDIGVELRDAGIDCQVGADPLAVLWQKLAFLAPVALTTTAFGIRLGDARERDVFRRCQEEAVAVARAEGVDLDGPALRALTEGAPATMQSSMQKDLAKGLPLELDGIAGPILRGGLNHGIPTPATEELVAAITGDPSYQAFRRA
jgi:2-dehydropantoate 2-reductase